MVTIAVQPSKPALLQPGQATQQDSLGAHVSVRDEFEEEVGRLSIYHAIPL